MLTRVAVRPPLAFEYWHDCAEDVSMLQRTSALPDHFNLWSAAINTCQLAIESASAERV